MTPLDENAQREIVTLWEDAQQILASLKWYAGQRREPQCDELYAIVSGELLRREIEHACVVVVSLEREWFDSGVVATRANDETMVNLVYLVRVGDPAQNALVYWAWSRAEVEKEMGDLPSGREATAQLATLRTDVADRARALCKGRRSWTGHDLRYMAEKAEIGGHAAAYSVLSWYSHSRLVGYDHRVTGDVGGQKIIFDNRVPPHHYETLANFSRRFLRLSYYVACRSWYGEIRNFSGSDPEDVRRDLERRHPDPRL